MAIRGESDVTSNFENHHRHSIRLKGYDYFRAGAYFVTICTQHRVCLFGEIINDKVMLNDAGNMITMLWNEMPSRFNHIELDEYIVMPNHIHGIIVISPCRGESCIRPNDRIRPNDGVDNGNQGEHRNQGEHKVRPYGGGGHHPCGTKEGSLGRIVQAFKSISTHAYINGVKQSGWRPFAGVVWQRNYWEHIVRDEQDLNRLREYIRHNPEKWALDELMVVH